jgi:esterase/lipase superfamily enzyme
MGKHIIRQTPKAMPSPERVASITRGLAKSLLVTGSRATATTENRIPDYEVHSNYRFSTGSLEAMTAKHLIFFIHGYNLTSNEALSEASSFFSNLHTSLVRDGLDVASYEYILFTWPGDTGTAYFDDAQLYAHHSGVALFNLLKDCQPFNPASITIVTHSLGAHVGLRGLSVLGERRIRQKVNFRVDHLLLLGAAVEDDVFSRPERSEEYHFPESAFGMKFLDIGISRDDNVLGNAFLLNEQDAALGFSGPETMETLVSLSRRVKEVLGPEEGFTFELHDFSSSSATIMNPDLHVYGHGDYWQSQKQTDYYINLITRQ